MLACNNILRVELKTLMGFLCEIRPGEVLSLLDEEKLHLSGVVPRQIRNSYQVLFSCCSVHYVGWLLKKFLV